MTSDLRFAFAIGAERHVFEETWPGLSEMRHGSHVGQEDTARDLPAQDGPECATDDRRLVDLREPLPVIKGLSGGPNSPLLPTLLQI